MPLSHYSLDTFVGQHLSKLTSCAPRSLASDLPDRAHWLDNFVLSRIFLNHVSEERAPLAFAMIRRAEAAVDEWNLACVVTREGVQKPSRYFKALRHFENSIAALWQGLNFGRRALDRDLFVKGDGSIHERINWIYNKSRHFDPSTLSPGDLHPVWLTNDGLHTREHAVTFEEVRSELCRLGETAQTISGAKPKLGDAGEAV